MPAPSEPEDPDREGTPAHHPAEQSLLRWRVPAPGLDELGVVTRQANVEKGAERGADADADEYESILREGEAALLDEDDGEGLEYWGESAFIRVWIEE